MKLYIFELVVQIIGMFAITRLFTYFLQQYLISKFPSAKIVVLSDLVVHNRVRLRSTKTITNLDITHLFS